MREPWHDDDTEPAWVQHWRDLKAAWERQEQRENRSLRLLHVSLVGFNLGLGLLAVSHYLDKQGWGYLLAALVHLCCGLYAARRLGD